MTPRPLTLMLAAALLGSTLAAPAAADGFAEKPRTDQPDAHHWPTTVLPEITTRIRLSSTDVNRLVCSEDIRDLTFSQEKGIEVRIVGKNAFIKFTAVRQGNRTLYSETPSEFFVVCGQSVYNLVSIPEQIPAQVVQLSSGQGERVRQNLALFEGLPLERKALRLIREAYADAPAASYLVRPLRRDLDLFAELELRLVREILVEGEGLRLRELVARLRPGQPGLRLKEQMFLRTELVDNPVAVAVEELLLQPGETTRIFVVEIKPQGEEWSRWTAQPRGGLP
ncbi:TraK domain-containing protein [Geoalkalibacter halelectricus]|uniref:TraK domain-containing protein n=1 Tax=Geoalkalibacter halelectricus TaxID=2847045 RepID=UPI003D1C3E0D